MQVLPSSSQGRWFGPWFWDRRVDGMRGYFALGSPEPRDDPRLRLFSMSLGWARQNVSIQFRDVESRRVVINRAVGLIGLGDWGRGEWVSGWSCQGTQLHSILKKVCPKYAPFPFSSSCLCVTVSFLGTAIPRRFFWHDFKGNTLLTKEALYSKWSYLS